MEKGPWNCSTNEMLFQMSKLKELIQLELINFDVRPGFDKALASCTNIKRLLLIPTYVTQVRTGGEGGKEEEDGGKENFKFFSNI